MKTLRAIITSVLLITVANTVLAQDNVEPGIVDPFRSQLPVSLWNDGRISQINAALRGAKPSSIPPINRARAIIALAQSRPALSPESSEILSGARLNLLFNHGVLDAAEALSNQFVWYPITIRTEVEKIALLTTRPDQYCAQILAKKFSEIEIGMSIYCFSRGNQWPKAVETYEMTKDSIYDLRRETLARFLELDEPTSSLLDEPWTEIPSPIDFVLDESFGRPRGEKHLPPAYAYFAREIGTNPHIELELTEELAKNGALPNNVLFATYKKYYPTQFSNAAKRAEISNNIAKLDMKSLPDDFRNQLNEAIDFFGENNLLEAFATQMAPYFSKIDLSQIQNISTRNTIIRLGLLGGWSAESWGAYIAKDDFVLSMAFKILHPDIEIDYPLNNNLPTKAARVIQKAFFETEPQFESIISPGEELLKAFNILSNIALYNDTEVTRSFQVLKTFGQTQLAKEVAMNILFGGPTP